VDDLDAKLRALTRTGDLGKLAKDLDAAGGAGHQRDERGLPGSILAEQGENEAGFEVRVTSRSACTGPKLLPRPTVRTAIWVSMDMTGYFAAETVVMLAWVPTTAAVGMK